MGNKFTDEDYLRVKGKYKQLKRMVERVIMTEFQFWLGPYAHENSTSSQHQKAQDDLRELVTGEYNLEAAAYSIDPDLENTIKKMRNRVANIPNGVSIGEARRKNQTEPEKVKLKSEVYRGHLFDPKFMKKDKK